MPRHCNAKHCRPFRFLLRKISIFQRAYLKKIFDSSLFFTLLAELSLCTISFSHNHFLGEKMQIKTKLVFVLLLISLTPFTLFGQSYEEMWKTIENAEKDGITTSTLEELKKISDKAIQEKNNVQEIKVICKKIIIESSIHNYYPEDIIKAFEKSTQTSNNSEIKPLLQAILAKLYLKYSINYHQYPNNQSNISNNIDLNDFTKWNSRRLYSHISELYDSALENKEVLANIPIEKYDSIIFINEYNKNIRKTIYDFLIHEALMFYKYNSNQIIKFNNNNNFNADSKLFDSVDEFINWETKTTDLYNNNYKIIKLYQKLLSFNKESNNIDALVFNNINRIVWANKIAVGKQKTQRYISALKQIIEDYSNNYYSSYALLLLAEQYNRDDEEDQALVYAELLCERWPDSSYKNSAKSLINGIKKSYLSITTDKIINSKTREIKIAYSAIKNIYLKLIKRNNDKFFYEENIDINEFFDLLKQKPDYSFNIELDSKLSYKKQTKVVHLPNIKKGFYWIIASYNKKHTNLSSCDIYLGSIIVSDLTVISRNQDRKDKDIFIVLDSITKKPLDGVSFKIIDSYYDSKKRKDIRKTKYSGKTNKYGVATYPKQNKSLFLLCNYKDDNIYTKLAFDEYKIDFEKDFERDFEEDEIEDLKPDFENNDEADENKTIASDEELDDEDKLEDFENNNSPDKTMTTTSDEDFPYDLKDKKNKFYNYPCQLKNMRVQPIDYGVKIPEKKNSSNVLPYFYKDIIPDLSKAKKHSR